MALVRSAKPTAYRSYKHWPPSGVLTIAFTPDDGYDAFLNRWSEINRRGSDGYEIPWWVQYSTDDEAGAGDAGEDAEGDGRTARRSFSRRRRCFGTDERQSRDHSA